jgi:hypothetical protein
VAAAAAVACLFHVRSVDVEIQQHDRWLQILETAQVRVPTEGPSLDFDRLQELIDTLGVVLPEIEAAEVTDLQTVRDCTEASLKVTNTSMEDSPRREQRGEAFDELSRALDTLIPEVQQSSDRLAARRIPVYGVACALGVATVVLAVLASIRRRG